MLQAGKTYYARIEARSLPEDSFATSPNRAANVWTTADVLTATFAP